MRLVQVILDPQGKASVGEAGLEPLPWFDLRTAAYSPAVMVYKNAVATA